MTEREALDFIHGIPRFNKELGLAKVRELLERLGRPQDQLKFVHVAGTNGKGSTCTMLSSILTKAGYQTGLVISPYILNFRERIQRNGEMIAPEELGILTETVKTSWEQMAAEGEPPSEFEVVLAIALLYFVKSGCEIVVLETGLGGRLDATNVIDAPLVAVITSISLEHTEYLGDTLEKIAWEKAAIIKPGSLVVSYPRQQPQVLAVLLERTAQVYTYLLIPHNVEILSQDIFGSRVVYNGVEYEIPLGGAHQVWNALTVLETCMALRILGFDLPVELVQHGIAATVFPSRIEVLSKEPLVLLDGAHNPSGVEALVSALKLLGDRKIHGIVGVLKNKDVEGIVAPIAPLCTTITTTQEQGNPQFVPPSQLAEMAGAYCDHVFYEEDPLKAFGKVIGRMDKEDVVIICGSLYLASVLRSPILEYFKGEKA